MRGKIVAAGDLCNSDRFSSFLSFSCHSLTLLSLHCIISDRHRHYRRCGHVLPPFRGKFSSEAFSFPLSKFSLRRLLFLAWLSLVHHFGTLPREYLDTGCVTLFMIVVGLSFWLCFADRSPQVHHWMHRLGLVGGDGSFRTRVRLFCIQFNRVKSDASHSRFSIHVKTVNVYCTVNCCRA